MYDQKGNPWFVVNIHCECREHTYKILVLAQKINMISNKAVLTRNSAPKLTSFLVKTALFDIMIFWARTSVFYMCVARNEITNFTGPEFKQGSKQERDPKPSERMRHKNISLLKKCLHLFIQSGPELFSI